MKKPNTTTERQNKLVRNRPRLMALEQRFMFDGAALVDAASTDEPSEPTQEPATPAVQETPIALATAPLLPVVAGQERLTPEAQKALQDALGQVKQQLANMPEQDLSAALREALAIPADPAPDTDARLAQAVAEGNGQCKWKYAPPKS